MNLSWIVSCVAFRSLKNTKRQLPSHNRLGPYCLMLWICACVYWYVIYLLSMAINLVYVFILWNIGKSIWNMSPQDFKIYFQTRLCMIFLKCSQYTIFFSELIYQFNFSTIIDGQFEEKTFPAWLKVQECYEYKECN